MLKGSDFLPLPGRGEPPNVTRFAPSPTGYLHLGHAYSAQFAYEAARRSGGKFLLRIEDIDQSRCRPEFEQGIIEDLRWLGLRWDGSVRRQSQHLPAYRAALRRLSPAGRGLSLLLHPQADPGRDRGGRPGPARALGRAPLPRHLPPARRGPAPAPDRGRRGLRLRLDVARALEATGPLTWRDIRGGTIPADPGLLGDVVLARKDVPTSYHLAVTVDDHAQGVTLVTRGEDLFHATHIHRLLQALLGLRTPRYYHHNLLADSTGQRLAKRNRAVTVRYLRERGQSPDDIWQAIERGLPVMAEAG